MSLVRIDGATKIQELQAMMENQLSELIPTFAQQGYGGEAEIEAELRFTETGYQAFFLKYSVLANLQRPQIK